MDVERVIQERLDSRQAKALSMIGMVTLMRSILSKTPVVKQSIISKIFLGSCPRGSGVHLLAWDVVCQPLSNGGLGIQSLVTSWEALIA